MAAACDMYPSFSKLLLLAAAGAALLAAPAVSQDIGDPLWSAGYGDQAVADALAVDPTTGDSYIAINFEGQLRMPSSRPSSYSVS